MMKEEQNVSRRDFLRRVSFAGAAGLGASTLLAACGGGEEEAAEATAECVDLAALSEQERQAYTTLEYVPETPIEDQYCSNCQFWQPDAPVAAELGAQCGGCQILPGAVAAQGYCISWAPQQA